MSHEQCNPRALKKKEKKKETLDTVFLFVSKRHLNHPQEIKSPLVFQLLYRKGFLSLFCIEIVSKDGDSFEISHKNNLR